MLLSPLEDHSIISTQILRNLGDLKTWEWPNCKAFQGLASAPWYMQTDITNRKSIHVIENVVSEDLGKKSILGTHNLHERKNFYEVQQIPRKLVDG